MVTVMVFSMLKKENRELRTSFIYYFQSGLIFPILCQFQSFLD